MKYLVISGIDGSGKTTVIEKVCEYFANESISAKGYMPWRDFSNYQLKNHPIVERHGFMNSTAQSYSVRCISE